MTLNLDRFRGGDRLDAGSLRGAVIDLLRSEPGLRARADRELLDAIDSLLAVGVGMSPVLNSYGQGVTLLAGALLRIVGANVDAVRADVNARDERGLEAVVHALVARLRAAAPSAAGQAAGQRQVAPQPVPLTTAFVPTEPPSPNLVSPAPQPLRVPAPSGTQAWSDEVASVPAISREQIENGSLDMRGSFVRPPEHDGRAVSGDNPALQYLRGLVTDELAAAIQGYQRSADATLSTPPVAAWVHVEVAPGVTLNVRADAAYALASRSGRAEALRTLDGALERLLGGLQGA